MIAVAPRQRRRRAGRQQGLRAGNGLEAATDEQPSGRVGFQPHHAVAVPRCLDLQGVSRTTSDKPQTTAMLRNIPNRYMQTSLMREINKVGFEGTYDFFYLPMDTHNRTNVGYSFINFREAQAFDAFTKAFSGYRFKEHPSQKVARVSPAHIQGFHENVQHFSNRAVTHSRNSQYRPVVMHSGKQCEPRGARAATEGVAAVNFSYNNGAEEAAASFCHLGPAVEEFAPTLADPDGGNGQQFEDHTSTPLVPVSGSWVSFDGDQGMPQETGISHRLNNSWNMMPQPFSYNAHGVLKPAELPSSMTEDIMKPFSLSKNGLEIAVSKWLQECANPAETRETSSTEGASCSQSCSMSQRSTSPVALHDQVNCPGDVVGVCPPGFSQQTPRTCRTLLSSTHRPI